MRLCSFLFLLNMTSCSWFHDLTVIDSSFSSLWYFKFNRRSSKEFCFDKLFQISCSKYFDVAFRFTSFISVSWLDKLGWHFLCGFVTICDEINLCMLFSALSGFNPKRTKQQPWRQSARHSYRPSANPLVKHATWQPIIFLKQLTFLTFFKSTFLSWSCFFENLFSFFLCRVCKPVIGALHIRYCSYI